MPTDPNEQQVTNNLGSQPVNTALFTQQMVDMRITLAVLKESVEALKQQVVATNAIIGKKTEEDGKDIKELKQSVDMIQRWMSRRDGQTSVIFIVFGIIQAIVVGATIATYVHFLNG